MTQTQHTPGPWFRGRNSPSGWYTVRVEDRGCTHGRIVAETMEPDDANAIVALPELLAALELAVSKLEAIEPISRSMGQQRAIDEGLYALAKARGEG